MSSYSVSPSSSLLSEGSLTFCNACGGSLPITTNFSENSKYNVYIVRSRKRICENCADQYKKECKDEKIDFSSYSYCGTCSLKMDYLIDHHMITYKFGSNNSYFGAMLVCKNCIEVIPVLEKINS